MIKVYLVIILIFSCGFSFILGALFFYKDNLNFFEEIKISVLNSLPYPELESFKEITYFFYKKTKNLNIGYVCGYVSYHSDIDFHQYQFKRFFVKVITDDSLKSTISIPFIEGVDDIITDKKMSELWNKYCSVKMNNANKNMV